MEVASYEESIKKGIAHLGNRWDPDAVARLNENRGSRLGCLNIVYSDSKAQCLQAWFKHRDLGNQKQWAYVAAKTLRMIFQIEPWRWFPAYEHLYAVISDCEELIRWYQQHRVPFFISDAQRGDEAVNKDDPRSVTFHSYQTILALRGEWEELHRRCERILALPEDPESRYFQLDHRFFLALAEGDQPGMEAALNRLTSPEVAKVRNFGVAFGLSENLIATHATLYAKIAWRHGHEIVVDSPWVPREWLPISPLQQYEEPWPFMQNFDLWAPFDGDWAAWSPKR